MRSSNNSSGKKTLNVSNNQYYCVYKNYTCTCTDIEFCTLTDKYLSIVNSKALILYLFNFSFNEITTKQEDCVLFRCTVKVTYNSFSMIYTCLSIC